MDKKINFDKLRKSLQNLSEEEIDKYFPTDITPKGWVSIEDYLPKMKAIDVIVGGTEYKVRCSDGTEGTTMVSDHNTWYYYAKEVGINYWFNE